MVALGFRAASWWFAAFVASVIYAAFIHNRIDHVYGPRPTSEAAFYLIAFGALTFVVTVYFVRQRDRFQKQSDDLLHNILPDEIAARLKANTSIKEFEGRRIRLRIGINSGPVVAGIIGTHKFAYDLWGDVVNTASRMQSEGVPGSIQISGSTFTLIGDRFVCDRRGLIHVKGKGEMETYLLVSRRSEDGCSAPP